MSATIVIPASSLCTIAASLEQTPGLRWPDSYPQKFIVTFARLKAGQRVFNLQDPLELFLERVADGWSCEEPILPLDGFGEESGDAVCSVFQDFSVLWDEIAQAPDEILADDAQGIKQKLRKLVKCVEEK